MSISKPSGDVILKSESLDVECGSQYSEKIQEVDYNMLRIPTSTLNGSYDTYMCNFCNTDVPQMYMKEHIASNIHKNCEKVGEYFLKCAKMPVFRAITNTEDISQKNWVYCECCSKAVMVKDELLHYSSSDHLKSLKRSTLVDDFIKNYIGNKNIETEIQIKEITSLTEDTNFDTKNDNLEQQNVKKRQVLDQDFEDIINADNLKNVRAKKQKLDEKNNSRDHINIETENSFNENKNKDIYDKLLTLKMTSSFGETEKPKTIAYAMYLKEINAIYSLKFNLPVVDFIVFESKNANKIEVTMDAFHSYKRFNNYVYCQVCCVLLTPETKQYHTVTESHVQRVIMPVNDNFARQITTSWKHCLICNEMVISDSKHSSENLNHKMYTEGIISETGSDGKGDYDKSYENLKNTVTCESSTLDVMMKTTYECIDIEQDHQLDPLLESFGEISSDNAVSQNNCPTDTCKNKAAGNNATISSNQLSSRSRSMHKIADNISNQNHESGVFSDLIEEIISKSDKIDNQYQPRDSTLDVIVQTDINHGDTIIHKYQPESYSFVKIVDSNTAINNQNEQISSLSDQIVVTVNSNTVINQCQQEESVSHPMVTTTTTTKQQHIDSSPFVKTTNSIVDITKHLAPFPKAIIETFNKNVQNNLLECKIIENNTDIINHNNQITSPNVGTCFYTDSIPQNMLYTSFSDSIVEDDKNSVNIINEAIETSNLFHENIGTNDNVSQSVNNKAFNTVKENATNITLNGSGKLEEFQSYIKEITTKCNLDFSPPDVNVDSIVIATPNGVKKNITVDIFHSFKQMNGLLICQICKEWISEDVRGHTFDATHIKRITQPVDNNFARQVNDTWSHCLLCNEMVLNDFDHVSISPNHKKVNVDQNEVANEYHNTHHKMIKYTENSHLNSQERYKEEDDRNIESKNVTDTANSVIQEIISKDLNKTTTLQNEEILQQENINIEDTQTFLYNIKDVIAKYNLNINTLVLEDVFKAKGQYGRELFEVFHSYKSVNGSTYCQVCQTWILGDMNVHSFSETHLRHITQDVDETFLRKVNESTRHCLICNELFVVSSNTHSAHDDLFKTKEIIFSKTTDTNSSKLNKSYKSDKDSYCSICDTILETSAFTVHMDSKQHLDNIVKEIKDDEETEGNIKHNLHNNEKTNSIINTSEPAVKIHDIQEEHRPRYCNANFNTDVFGMIKVYTKTYESREITEFRRYLKDVINRYKLKKLPRFVLKPQSIDILLPSGVKYNVTVDVFHGYHYVRGFVYCQVCRRWLYEDKVTHSLTKRHVEAVMMNSVSETVTRKTHGVWHHCLVCNIPIKNILGHTTKSKRHKKLYKYELGKSQNAKTNQANDDDDDTVMIYCDDCDEYILAHIFSGHTKSTNHIKNNKDKLKKNIICIDSSDDDDKIDTNKKSATNIVIKKDYSDTNTNVNAAKSSVGQMAKDFRLYINNVTKKFNKRSPRFVDVKDDHIVVTTPSGFKEKISVDDFHSFKYSKESLFCQVCQVYVSTDRENHSYTKPHVEHITQPLDNNFARQINKAWRHCLVCNTMVFGGVDHVNFTSKHDKYREMNNKM